MTFLSDICVLLGILVIYAIALYLIATDFQIKRMGWSGYPALLVLFLINKSHRFGIWFRQNTRREIAVEDLPTGEYTVVNSIETELTNDWTIYDYRSKVNKAGNAEKIWTVLSQRPLPSRFKITADNHRNLLRKIETTTKATAG
jgi:transcription initiation factor IIF auxiliary subunit